MLIDSFSCLFPVHYFLSYLTILLSRLTHSFILRWGDSNPINLTAGTEDPVPTGLGLLLLTEKRKHWWNVLLTEKRKHWPNDSLIGSSERPCAPTATYLYLEWDCKQLGLFSFMLRNRVFHTPFTSKSFSNAAYHLSLSFKCRGSLSNSSSILYGRFSLACSMGRSIVFLPITASSLYISK